MKRELVVKDNALINASYYLDLVEQRIILLAILEARRSNTGITADKPVVIHADSYILQFNVARQTAYQVLMGACKSLFERKFTFIENRKNETVTVVSRWVSQIAYIENSAKIEIIFAPAVVPLITQLEARFTQYELQQVRNLTSIYAIRLYELLMQWKGLGKTPLFALEDFRQKIGVKENQYKRMGQFKEKVLDIAITQINKHTDIDVAYEQHKQGRSISGFTFSFKHKASMKDITPTAELKPLTGKQLDYFAKQLSQDAGFGSQFAHAGESSSAFTQRLTQELKDPTKQRDWQQWLTKYDKMSK